jgi:hypothetical protein
MFRSFVCLLVAAHVAPAAEVVALRTQTVDGVTYFHVRLAPPAGWQPSAAPERRPVLLPQDATTWAVAWLQGAQPDFVGRCLPKGKSTLTCTHTGGQQPLTLDWATAHAIVPQANADNLADFWRQAVEKEYTALAQLSGNTGFYRYALAAFHRQPPARPWPDAERNRRLFDNRTTVTELADQPQRSRETETVPVTAPPALTGQPAAKDDVSFAAFVPADQYLVAHADFATFMQANDWLAAWQAAAQLIVDPFAADAELMPKLERQLCLAGDGQARKVGGLVVRSVAMTGSDWELADGSDVALLFRVSNTFAFRLGQEAQIVAARRANGKDWTSETIQHLGVAIDSHRSARRDVCLYRATLGDVIVCANSLVGIQRIIATHARQAPALSQDAGYRAATTALPGQGTLLYVPAAFWVNQAQPDRVVVRVRRQEALATVVRANRAAMWAAWLNGTPMTAVPGDIDPTNSAQLAWDARLHLAYSAAFGSPGVAVPLAEQRVDKLSAREAQAYQTWLADWQKHWQPVLGPLALRAEWGAPHRIALWWQPAARTVVPELERRIGGGARPVRANEWAPPVVAQVQSHIAPQAPEKQMLLELLHQVGLLRRVQRGLNWMGDGVFVRLEESPVYTALLERFLRERRATGRWQGVPPLNDWLPLAAQVPWTVGLEVDKPVIFLSILLGVRTGLDALVPGAVDWQVVGTHLGVPITRVICTGNGLRRLGIEPKQWLPGVPPPTVFYALAEGTCYTSATEVGLKRVLDRLRERKERDPRLPENAESAHAAGFLSVAGLGAGVAEQLRDFGARESARQQHAGWAHWLALHRAGATAPSLLAFGTLPAGDVTTYPALVKPADPTPAARALRSLQSVRLDLRLDADAIRVQAVLDAP